MHADSLHRGEGIDIVEDPLPWPTGASGGETLPRRLLDGVTWVTVPEVTGHRVGVFTDGQVS